MNIAADLFRWLQNLDPAFAFLLALPFAVGLLGLLSLALSSRDARNAKSPLPEQKAQSAGGFRNRAHS